MTRDAAAELAGFKKMGDDRWVGMILGFPVEARPFFGEMTLLVYVDRPVYYEQIDAVFVESEIPLEKYFSRQVASLEMLVEGA